MTLAKADWFAYNLQTRRKTGRTHAVKSTDATLGYMNRGTLIKWLKKEGDKVKASEVVRGMGDGQGGGGKPQNGDGKLAAGTLAHRSSRRRGRR